MGKFQLKPKETLLPRENSFGGLLDKNSPLEMKSCHPISFQYRKDPMGIKLMGYVGKFHLAGTIPRNFPS